jgi:L-seryl-tRNA(Ser) seleniumtransferase
MIRKTRRRHFLQQVASLPFAGGLAGVGLASAAPAEKFSSDHDRDFFAELGIRPVINGQGVVTTLTGSLLPPEVIAAMNFASTKFVRLVELQEKVGARIASMLHCEDALVSCGAASAITLATAATLTGKDPEKIRLLPNLEGPPRQVVMPKGHRIYPQQFQACGVRLVEVDGPAEMDRALYNPTTMAFFFNASPIQSISREEFIRIGRKHKVPTFIDCASDVPPVENLFKYIALGFDLVTFSGGKAICGPQSAGLLFGRKDLIAAARLNHSPNQSIGRGMKVSKEEIIGMMVALELYLKKDHARAWAEWERGVEQIAASVRTVSSVVAEKYIPEVANHVPHVRITWDETLVKISPAQAAEELRHGDPSIEVLGGRDAIIYNMFMIRPEEVRLVAGRTREVLEQAARRR